MRRPISPDENLTQYPSAERELIIYRPKRDKPSNSVFKGGWALVLGAWTCFVLGVMFYQMRDAPSCSLLALAIEPRPAAVFLAEVCRAAGRITLMLGAFVWGFGVLVLAASRYLLQR
mgnify:CR=1 FL=1